MVAHCCEVEALIWGTAVQCVEFGAPVLCHPIPPSYKEWGKGFSPYLT